MVIAAVRIAFSLLIVICRVLGLSLSALLHSVSHLVLFLFFPILQNHLVLILFFPTLPIHLILSRPSPLQLPLICLLLHGTIHLQMTFGSRKIRENLQIRPQFIFISFSIDFTFTSYTSSNPTFLLGPLLPQTS